jgi:hypothetical protein
MKINRQQIKEALFRVIDHIADKEYQRRIWIMGLGPEVDDFDETVCNFVDPADDVIKNFKEYNLTKNQAQVLERFHEIFVAFANKNDFPFEFIDTPEWQHVIDEAKKVLEAFHYKMTELS